MIGNDRRSDIGGGTMAGLDTLYLHTNQTPKKQLPANPALHPAVAAGKCNHYEIEGSDWNSIYEAILQL